MAARAHWKGYLRVSLVSCPIALYPAIAASERISFRQVNRETGNRLRQQPRSLASSLSLTTRAAATRSAKTSM